MIQDTITSVSGTSQKIKIENPSAKLLIKITDSAIAATAETNLLGLKVTLDTNFTGKGGQQNKFNKIPLIDLAIISQQSEGYFLYDKTNKQYELNIDLSPDGALELSTDNYLELQFSDVISTQTIEVWNLDIEGNSKTMIHYNQLSVKGGVTSPSEWDITNVHSLVLDASNVDKIQLTYSSGKTVTYEATELKAMMRDLNDIVYANLDGTKINTGYMNWFIINVDRCTKVSVFPVDTDSFTNYAVSYKQVL